MKILSAIGAARAALPIFLISAFATMPAASAERAQAPLAPLYAGAAGPQSYVAPELLPGPRRAATFAVTYSGFSPAAQAAFQAAVNVWAQRVTSSVPITVSATYTNLGNPNILGQAGSSFIWRNFPGAPRPNVWYVDAIANKRAGSQRDPAPDIVASFNSTFPNWHFGAGAAPANTYDFTSVVMHELGHGLGFLGAGRLPTATTGSVKFGTPANPISYDRFTESASGRRLTAFPDNSPGLKNVLTSNALFFDSPNVRAVNSNQPAKLYAPTSFRPGSSYSHLDETRYPRGNPNSLMTSQLGQGETIRNPGFIVNAIFKDIGW